MKFKIKKSYYRLFSVLLSVIMIVLSVPISAFAGGGDGTVPTIPPITEGETVTPEPIDPPPDDDGGADAGTNGVVVPPVPDDPDPDPYPMYLDDGVYTIRNVGNTNMYMDTWGDSPMPQKYMQQTRYSSAPAITASRGCYFKITRISNTRYVIRLMTNNCLTLASSGSDVITSEIDPSNSSVPASKTFTITASSNGYTIRSYANNKLIVAPDSQASGGDDTAARLDSASSATGNRDKWIFTKYTGTSRHFVDILEYPEEVLVSNGATIKAYASSTTQNINAPIFSVLNTDLTSTTKAEINSSSGALTAKEAGNIYVRASCGGTTTTVDVLVHILPNMEGNYFLKGAHSFRYVAAQSDIVQLLHEFQMWKVEHVENGFYKILFESTNLSLTSPSTINTDITCTTYNGSTYQQWQFIEQTDGTYKISPRFNSQYYLSAGALSPSNNSMDLVVRTDQIDARDEWFLLRANSDSPKQINAEIIYDFGYSERYSDAVNRINSELVELQKKYLEAFDIFVNCSSPSSFFSYGDACGTNPTQGCTHLCTDDCQSTSHSDECGNSCEDSEFNPTLTLGELHHKNTTNMVLRIPFPDTSNTFKVAFLGHDHCDIGIVISSSHVKNFRNGIAYTSLGLCAVMNYENQVEETKTLIHEFGHLLGAPDHYSVGCPSTDALNQVSPDTHNEFCIYGEKRGQDIVSSNYLICEGCQAYIMATVDNYDHS